LQNLSTGSKWLLWVAINLAVDLMLLAGGAAGGGSLARLPYVVLMFALCSSPIPFIGRLNGAFAMLGVAMAAFFFKFGMLDAVSVISPPIFAQANDGLLDGGEVVLLFAALMQIAGFHIGARLLNVRTDTAVAKDWPASLLVPAGLLLWSLGCGANLYQNLIIQVGSSDAVVKASFTKLGVWGTSGLMLINYAGPLGIVILAYWWSSARRRYGNALMLGIIFAQFALGWAVDTKEVAVNAPMVMLLTRFVVQGKIPVRWALCSIIGIILIFPVLTAKRAITTEALHLTNVQALPRAGEILWRAITERNEALAGKYAGKTQTFLERATDKGSVELFVQRVGNSQPYKLGSTLVPMLYVFIPRLVFSDKPGGNSAQTFNRDFHLSEDPDTYMSPSHAGELYWNFGLLGEALGMLMIGTLLGFVCARFDLSARTSLTRVLVIIVTLYELVARAGGQIELEYVLWARTLLLIGILHWFFARVPQQSPLSAASQSREAERADINAERLRFPHLLR
jgi:hypothetical protein